MDASTDRGRTIRALVFDFDGLILDTESAAFRAWSEEYAAHGLDLPLERWIGCVGTDHSAFDPYRDLEQNLGRALDRGDMRQRLRDRQLAIVAGMPPRPGVLDVLDRASALGLRVGMASSSDRSWLELHLRRLDLAARFPVIASRDDVERVKPNPALYVQAIAKLGVAPSEALAFEDSLPGIRAAKSAGLRCVAIPNEITTGMALHEADWVLPSLASCTLDAIVARFG
jgi:HAD superfamily hydrolase (TIGR01509 family)